MTRPQGKCWKRRNEELDQQMNNKHTKRKRKIKQKENPEETKVE